jgi:DNA-binding XRE family transcriptional regulator
MTTETISLTGYAVALEVRRTETGTYEIPGAAEPEDWHEVRTALDDPVITEHGALVGWGPWEHVAQVEDQDGLTRWYFLARDWPTTLADRLREARHMRGLTQIEVGEATGIAQNVVSAYERGARRPELDALTRLADCYGVTLDWLAGRDAPCRTTASIPLPSE